MKIRDRKKPAPPLDKEGLERIALFYVGRYATTRAKLKSYLLRKVRERGWSGEGELFVEPLVERLASLGYIDDRAFASAKASSLQRRGFGARRVDQAFRAAGIAEADAAPLLEEMREGALAAALRFARRKRIGPFASGEPDRAERQKAFAAMMRAGHSHEIAREVLNLRAGDIPECDSF